MQEESLSKPLFIKRKKVRKSHHKPRSYIEIIREAQSDSQKPKGEPNYWGLDKTLWKK